MKDIRFICSLDPGVNGGVSVFDNFTGEVVAAPMPKDVEELVGFFNHYKEAGKTIVFIEKVSVRPDDVNMGGGNKFGKLFRVQKMIANYESLKTIIGIACGLPYVLVHPMKWQSGLKIRKSGEDYTERKRRFKDIAQDYYPQVKVTLKTSDALLIMHFGRLAIKNSPKWVKQQLPSKEASLFAL